MIVSDSAVKKSTTVGVLAVLLIIFGIAFGLATIPALFFLGAIISVFVYVLLVAVVPE